MKFGKYINLRIFAKINTHSSQKLQTHTLLNTKMKSFNQFLIVSYEYFSSTVNMHVQHDVFIHIYRHCVKLKKMDGIKRNSHLSNVPNEKNTKQEWNVQALLLLSNIFETVWFDTGKSSRQTRHHCYFS